MQNIYRMIRTSSNQITEAIIDQSCEDLENITNSLGFIWTMETAGRCWTPLAQDVFGESGCSML